MCTFRHGVGRHAAMLGSIQNFLATPPASGIADDAGGTGLSIVRALVRDELRGTLDLHSNGGLRAEVVFPA